MRIQYCWRCKKDVPMFDDHEFKSISQAYAECTKRLKSLKSSELSEIEKEKFYNPFFDVVKSFTKDNSFDFEIYEVLKHQISRFGPPCPVCEKPLRTPKAKKCVECGLEMVVSTNPEEEKKRGRIPLWLDLEDLLFLSKLCVCDENAGEIEKSRCARIRFRANAAIHKNKNENKNE